MVLTTDEHDDKQPTPEQVEAKPLPLLVCHGEGYVTKPDGTIIPFTLSGEVNE